MRRRPAAEAFAALGERIGKGSVRLGPAFPVLTLAVALTRPAIRAIDGQLPTR